MLKAACDPAEKQVLLEWLGAETVNPDAVNIVGDYLENPIDIRHIDEAVIVKLQYSLDLILENRQSVLVRRIHFLRTTWFRVAVAVIIVLGISTYLWLNPSSDGPMMTKTPSVASRNDVLPGSNQAILTLADGQEIQLDNNTNSLLAEKGIINRDASIVYSGKGQGNVMNTLTTPRGGQYQITLPDGTKVWLNAASSITYPTVFTGRQRAVIVVGEAYFEVAKDKSMPFIVKTNAEQITVLGTSFNVYRYMDEPGAKISLIEGSVKVGEKILQPGQAWMNGKVVKTNIEQDVAWKNGVFDFNGADMQTIMRKIERWYDVEVVFEGEIPAIDMHGQLPRHFTLQQILAAFADVGLRYQLTAKQLIISP